MVRTTTNSQEDAKYLTGDTEQTGMRRPTDLYIPKLRYVKVCGRPDGGRGDTAE